MAKSKKTFFHGIVLKVIQTFTQFSFAMLTMTAAKMALKHIQF